MNIIELSTLEIAALLKSQQFPFNQKTLIKDRDFLVDAFIVTPLYIEKSDSYHHKVINLNNFSFWQEIVVVFLFPYRNSQYWFQEWLFNTNQQVYVNRFHKIEQKNLSQYIAQPINRLQTVVAPYEVLEKELLQAPYCFVNPDIEMFPPATKNFTVISIAFIYDYQNLKQTYKEVQEIVKELKKFFPQLQVSIFSYPLSAEQLDQLFMTHTIIHFAGHIKADGLMINASTNYTPLNLIPNQVKTKLLFLNGCRTPLFLLQTFVSKKIENIIFLTEDQLDILINSEQIIKFYVGIFLGYHIIDALSIIKNKKMRLHGWAHTTFSIG